MVFHRLRLIISPTVHKFLLPKFYVVLKPKGFLPFLVQVLKSCLTGYVILLRLKKHDKDQWLEVHRQAHKQGIKSTATMMYGTVETIREIVEHWDYVRQLQDETGGFRAFIMWSYQSDNTQLKRELPTITKTTSNQYLRYLAVARLFLDNVPNIQSSWVTQGSYIGQMALLFGANDLGSTMMEENVVSAAGAKNEMNQDEMIKLIRDVGEKPAKRNTAYEILEKF